jgi:PAS domain S-box-containing protein
VGKHIWDVFPQAENTEVREHIESTVASRDETTYDRYNERLDRWFQVRVYPDDGGTTILFEDVTQQKQREEELERYEHILENLPVAVGQNVDDDDEQFTYVNETMVEMFGGDSKSEVKSQAVRDIYADPERRNEIVERLKAEQRVEGAEARFETLTGEEFWGALTATLEAGDGEREFVGILEDISERKERERRIRQLHEATRELLAAETPTDVAELTSRAAVDILGVDLNGVHLYDEAVGGLVPSAVSPAGQDVFGDAPVLDEGLAWEAFTAGEASLHSDVGEAENVYNEETMVGSELYVPLAEHGVLILASTDTEAFDERDMTLAKLLGNNAGAVLGQIEREQRLRERERELERAETLFQNAQDAFFLVDVDQTTGAYTIERVNPAYESLTGLSSADITGKSMQAVFDPGDAATMRAHYDECVANRKTVEYVEELSVPEPESYWETRIAPVVVDDEVVQIVGATRNITNRKAYEQQLEEQRDRLELLNQMVRHDIRNDLQVISSYAELLKGRVDDDQEYVDRILTNARTAVELTRTARDLSGTMLQTDTSTEPVPLRSVLLSQIDEIRTTYTDAVVTVEDRIPSVAVVADDMLASVFRNIVKNAIQHNDKPIPEVHISVAERGGRVRVTVVDNGPGVPDEQKGEIFGKGEKGLESEGTGIGLYLVNTLVERYGGEIQVHDNEPEGTIVTVALDRA